MGIGAGAPIVCANLAAFAELLISRFCLMPVFVWLKSMPGTCTRAAVPLGFELAVTVTLTSAFRFTPPPGTKVSSDLTKALQSGGVIEFGEREPGTWQVRLVVPRDEEDDGEAALGAAAGEAEPFDTAPELDADDGDRNG